MNWFFVEEPFDFRLGFSPELDVPDESLTPFDDQVFHGVADDEGTNETGLASHLQLIKVYFVQYLVTKNKDTMINIANNKI